MKTVVTLIIGTLLFMSSEAYAQSSLPSGTATYSFRGTQIQELIEFAERHGYGFPLSGTTVSDCIREVVTREDIEKSWYHLQIFSTVQRVKFKVGAPVLRGVRTQSRTCRFGFFTGKRLQNGWKLKSVKIQHRPNVLCAGKTKSVTFSKIPIPLSDDASFEVRMFYDGRTYSILDSGCYDRLLRQRRNSMSSEVYHIKLQGPVMADWRMAFREPGTLQHQKPRRNPGTLRHQKPRGDSGVPRHRKPRH